MPSGLQLLPMLSLKMIAAGDANNGAILDRTV
jgi:hypothetical protein